MNKPSQIETQLAEKAKRRQRDNQKPLKPSFSFIAKDSVKDSHQSQDEKELPPEIILRAATVDDSPKVRFLHSART